MDSKLLLRVAVVGAGSIAREYALCHLVSQLGVVVVAVVDKQLELAENLARDVALSRAGGIVTGSKYRQTVDPESRSVVSLNSLPTILTSASLAEVLPLVDCCYIATPPNTHAELALQALASGKHVLLEKPLAVTDADADRIVDAANTAYRTYGAITNINIGMRFVRACQQLRDIIAQGTLGSDLSLQLRMLFRQWPREWQMQPWVAQRAQGGPLLEVGSHLFFGLLEVTDYVSIETVTCEVVYPDGENGSLCESSVRGVLTLATGISVSLEVDTCSAEAKAQGSDIYELTAIGSLGSRVLYDFVKLRDGQSGADLACGDMGYGRKEFVTEMVRAAREGRHTANLVTPEQARCVQRLLSRIRNTH
jgi:predicted dehydrogenase